MPIMIRKSPRWLPMAALSLTLGAVTLAGPSSAAEKADQSEAAGGNPAGQVSDRSRHCLSLSQIKRIEIIDDQTLKFHMRGGGPDYLNHLPYRCPGLKHRGAFMHATSTSNYCDLDIITQIDTSIGMRLGSCPLGNFEAVARESQ